jgi:putative toxin-antitoxin system antitoxin component (TIGR02293 family)
MSAIAKFEPTIDPQPSAYNRALLRVSEMAKGNIRNQLDEIALTQAGIMPTAVEKLAKSIVTINELSWVIARRTLTHRKNKGEKLTPEESGRWLRAAKICALAEEVFGDKEKASTWLHKPRKAFNAQNAIAIMQTEAGARLVEDTLNQIDAGYFA